MAYKKYSGRFKSSNEERNVCYYIYEPEGKPVGIVQISHGVFEYLERYEHFISYLCENGFLVCGHDHLGHGMSIEKKEDYGHFANENGWKNLVKDTHSLTLLMKKKYGEDIPYYLLGHSMGSFIARLYTKYYGKELSGLLLVGTSGTNPLSLFGMAVAKTAKLLRGERHRSKMIHILAFAPGNIKFIKEFDSLSWIVSKKEVRDEVRGQERTTFLLTAAGYYDLFYMLYAISKKDWYESVPKTLPIALLSGAQDFVGNYAKGVMEVYLKLKNVLVKDVDLSIYPNMRHEILNEHGKEKVYEDIVNWIFAQEKKKKK